MQVRMAKRRAGRHRQLALVAEVGRVGVVGGEHFVYDGHLGLPISERIDRPEHTSLI